jgi:hypothetical protein
VERGGRGHENRGERGCGLDVDAPDNVKRMRAGQTEFDEQLNPLPRAP